MKKRNGQVEELKTRLEETTNRWKRAVADYRNLERTVKEEQASVAAFANAVLIQKLLPILDNLEQVIDQCPTAEKKNSWFQGVALVVGQYRDLLKGEGVKEIPAIGKTFDPALHEVVDTIEKEDENMITHVYTKGYTLHDRVIRPARVQVSKRSGKEKPSSAKATEGK